MDILVESVESRHTNIALAIERPVYHYNKQAYIGTH